MGKLKKITLTMENGEDLEFFPLFESFVSITRGHRDKIKDIPDMFPEKEPNGNEVMLIVSAPAHIKDEIVKAATEITDKMINS
jgi:hypothetical protein